MKLNKPKTSLKAFLEKNGWYLRKTKGVPRGIDCFHELRHRLNGNLKTVLDVGAHHGETTLAVVERFPNAVVHAFEPVKSNFDILEAAVRHLPNVACHQLALGDRPGTVEIVLQEHSATHTLKRQAPMNGLCTVPTAHIEVTTLDAFLLSTPVQRADLLKLDVEGYEVNVLKGAEQTLSKNPPRFLLLEATLDPTADIHCFLPHVAEFLNMYRYKLLSIYDQVIWPAPARLAFFNALFGLDTCL